MDDAIKLIVGLANPGQQYADTRHNAGEWFINRLQQIYTASLRDDPKTFARTAKLAIGSQTLRIAVPNTYMNHSGKTVGAIANFYKLSPESILVVHDELDLSPGIAKFKHGGGHGGHNGLRDIIAALGNQKNFYRLRIGIGHPGQSRDVSNYVLHKAKSDERQLIDDSIEQACAVIDKAVAGQWNDAMHQLHSQ